MDFGYGNENNGGTANSYEENTVTNISTGKEETTVGTSTTDDINSISDINEQEIEKNKEVKENKESEITESNGYNVVPGAVIEIGDEKYTVDNSGNVLDANGNIFKEAADVDKWFSEFDAVKAVDESSISIDSLKDVFGIDITDEEGKPIEFENTPDGIKSYVNAVVESKQEEIFDSAINGLYERYPVVKDVLNYYIANGNSLEGFGEIPDRSNIIIDDSNEAQQEYIIRVAWEEQGRKGDVNGYIQYLKSSGMLLATAKEELQGLQEADEAYQEQIEREAEERETKRIEELRTYWQGVYDVVNKREIAGYQIPESIVVNRNGQKMTLTPEDFFNYMYRVDNDGVSAYERDLMKETPESRRDDEILRAYLKFVGGNYSNLVGMAINKEKVNTLKFKAKERTASTVRISNPKQSNNKEIDLGYN